jgi:hypothetical protein
MEYCPECGARIEKGNMAFCGECGAKLGRPSYDYAKSGCRDHHESGTSQNGAPRPPGGPPGPLPLKELLAMIFAIVTFILIAIALASPWYTASGEGWEDDQYLGDYETIEDDESETHDYTGAMKNVGGGTSGMEFGAIGLLICVIVLIVIGMIFIFMKRVWYNRYIYTLAFILTFIAFLFALISPLFFAGSWPGAIEEEFEYKDIKFFGGTTTEEPDNGYDDREIDYAPGAGWYIALVGGIMALLTMIFVFLARKNAVSTDYGGARHRRDYSPPRNRYEDKRYD